MELFNKSEAFHQFLRSLPQQECEKVFSETYRVSVLGVGCSTPFSSFVGQRDRPTVVISKHAPKASELSLSVNDNSGNLEGLETIADHSSNYAEHDDPLPVTVQKTVPVGQPLTNNRVYLTHSVPFYGGWSGANIKSVTCATRDRGLIPLPLDSARYICSLYSLGTWKATDTLPDVWVVCERNMRGVVALGCAYDAPKRALLTFTVEDGGTGPRVDMKSKLDKTNVSAASVFSEYDIISGSFEENGQPGGGFKMEFAWHDPDGMLSSPPRSSSGILKLSNKPGDPFSPVLFMFEELKSLYRLCEIAKGVTWTAAKDSEEEVLALSDKTISKEIEVFIEEIAHPLTQPADITVMSPTSDHMIYEPRTDLDFTERLWLFCRDVTSFDDLKLVFSEVFKAVLLGKVQPFVHRKSTSKLALLLRQFLLSPDGAGRQDAALKFQHLLVTEARLLLYLIQLGVEKIKRDYRSFLVGTDICSSEQFERFFEPASSTPLAQCLELCKLHAVLELNVSIMRMLKLPTTILSSFTRAAMEVLVKDQDYQPFSPTPTFCIPLPAYSPALKSVAAMCSELSPTVWSLATNEQRKDRSDSLSVDVIYLIRNEPLFCYLQTSADPQDNEYHLYKCQCQATSIN